MRSARRRAIAGIWRIGYGGRPSVNIDKVNQLTGSGMPLGEAVRHTWTATRAARRGFSKISVIGEPQGGPGQFTKVDVLIERMEG